MSRLTWVRVRDGRWEDVTGQPEERWASDQVEDAVTWLKSWMEAPTTALLTFQLVHVVTTVNLSWAAVWSRDPPHEHSSPQGSAA